MKRPTEPRPPTTVSRYGVLAVIFIAFFASFLLSFVRSDSGAWLLPILLALLVTGVAMVFFGAIPYLIVEFLTRRTARRKAKPDALNEAAAFVEPLTLPDEPLDNKETYALASDGEMLEVVDDVPPALSFKHSDDETST